MKEKTKEFLKKYLIGFILGFVSVGIVVVYAETYFPSNDVTYDNTESGLSSTNVQGAIDELYGVCFPPKTGGEAILDNTDIVTSGDGLYEDEYKSCRYLYRGRNPNNYITFNDEKAGWRIISIECDGTIKIMRNESIGTIEWDKSNTNNWADASLKDYLNGDYYSGLDTEAQKQIVTSTYNIGGVTFDNNDMKKQLQDEEATKWYGKVALPVLSEYIRACSNTNCKTLYTYGKNYSTCRTYDWMYTRDVSRYWMPILSPVSNNSNNVFFVDTDDATVGHSIANYRFFLVRPVVTILSSAQIIDGDGSQSNPYQIS